MNSGNKSEHPASNIVGKDKDMTKLIQKSISIPCHPKYLSDMRVKIQEILAEVNIADHEKGLIVLAIDEAASSIVQYAKDKAQNNEITLTLDVDDVRLKATVNDSLNVFDFNGGNDVQIVDRINSERQYKLSIHLIRMVMDEMTYTYKKGFENQLEMIKFL